MMTTQYTEEQLEAQSLWESPTIEDQLPIKFNSGYSLNNFDMACGGCNGYLPHTHVHGRITRPTPDVALVSAAGYCHTCNQVTVVHYRAYSDLRITSLQKGRWITEQASVDRGWFFNFLRSIIQALIG